MLACSQRGAAGWKFWGVGIVTSMLALLSAASSPDFASEYPLCAALALTFYLGLLRSD